MSNQPQKTIRLLVPVKLYIRSLPDNTILAIREDTLKPTLTEKEISAIEAQVKCEECSYETVMLKLLEARVNKHNNTKIVLADFTQRYPEHNHIVVELKLNGKITKVT